MIYRQFYFNRKQRITVLTLTILFALLAIFFPVFTFNLLGYTIAGATLCLLGFYGFSLIKQYRHFLSIPLPAYYQLGLLTLLALVFIIIPATSLQDIVSLLLFFALLIIGIYHLYLRQKLMYLLPTNKNYIYGVVSLIGAFIVLFYREESSERFMQLIGCIFLYYAITELWKLRR